MNRKHLFRGTAAGLSQFARQNRKMPTQAEKIMWDQLRGRKFHGFKFRRQQPMGNFVLDFFCLEANLAIEVDGGYHDQENQIIYDQQRTIRLNELHVTVLRFSNDEVINDIAWVLEIIDRYLRP